MKIFCTFAPQSVLDGGFQFEAYITEDLKRFGLKQLRSPRRKLPRSRILGWDTEYTPDGKLLTVGLADLSSAEAIETTDPHWLKRIRPVIKNAEILCGHSLGGDLDYLVKYKLAREDWLKGVNIRDSLLLARSVDENRGKGGYGLEALFLSEYAASPWKDETAALLKKTGNAADWTVKQRTERCRLDAWATKLLADKYYEALTKPAKAPAKVGITPVCRPSGRQSFVAGFSHKQSMFLSRRGR